MGSSLDRARWVIFHGPHPRPRGPGRMGRSICEHVPWLEWVGCQGILADLWFILYVCNMYYYSDDDDDDDDDDFDVLVIIILLLLLVILLLFLVFSIVLSI